MNKKSKFGIIIAALIALSVSAMSTANMSYYNASAQQEGFTATLSGQEEVPPTNSTATGNVDFTVTGEDSIDYTVNITNIKGVTDGHIHLGILGENGPIVFTLFRPDAPVNEVNENETITSAELEGPFEGRSLSDLITVMSNGSAYVNVHTQENPNGEIRGQIAQSQ